MKKLMVLRSSGSLFRLFMLRSPAMMKGGVTWGDDVRHELFVKGCTRRVHLDDGDPLVLQTNFDSKNHTREKRKGGRHDRGRKRQVDSGNEAPT